MNNNIEQLTSNMTSIKADLVNVQLAKDQSDKALQQSLENTTVLNDLTRQMKDMQIKCTGLLEENIKLKKDSVALDNYGRRQNLVIRGITEDQDEDEERCLNVARSFFKNNLKVSADTVDTIQIVRCHRLGAKLYGNGNRQGGRSRPIIIRFEHYADRQLIWGKRNQLAGSKLSLNENFSPATEYKRRLLYPILAKAKRSGKYNNKAFLNVDRLRIDDKTYTVDTLHKLPTDLQPRTFAYKTNEKYIVFGGIHSEHFFLSNFYKLPEKMKVDGNTFSSLEQAYQFEKAVRFRDTDSEYKILSASTPSDAKSYGNRVQNFQSDLWDSCKKDVMLKLLRIKFKPKSDLAKMLLATYGKSLAEAGASASFSIGLYLSNDHIFNKNKWTGANLLGDCLEMIRDELKEE